MKDQIQQKIEKSIDEHKYTPCYLYSQEYCNGRNDSYEHLRTKAPQLAQEIIDMVVESLKEPLENAFYECNLEPEEAEEEAKNIINLFK